MTVFILRSLMAYSAGSRPKAVGHFFSSRRSGRLDAGIRIGGTELFVFEPDTIIALYGR
ncbi:hypothetical protein [Nisaea nitritireducens]|uniref:hypothetical protein n=1 Tax=Nisaea nitritireducens TaxID=568392 RepID=UPI001865BE53|nr:hypothetical protein [Nisaea nitritireducens]